MSTRTNGHPVLNFGAGPAKLPEEVLKEVQSELIHYKDTEISIMEMSHRSKEYLQINDTAQKNIRQLMNVPDNYKVLFLHGGGSGLFAVVAMNLMGRTGTADYMVTGTWSGKAAQEAVKYGKVNLVFPKVKKYTEIPHPSTWNLDSNASYVYYCANETVDGVEFPYIPETNGVPLVADMSSSIMTREIDVSKFGIIFGGAQKNIGPAGVTVAIVREDLIGHAIPACPSIFDLKVVAANNSVHNTPATFCVYVMNCVFEWIKRNGGVKEMERLAILKSNLLYDLVENSKNFYSLPVTKAARSRQNVPFRVGGKDGIEELEETFLKEAEKHHMYQLRGHRTVGGLRASIYNAVSLRDVQILADFMVDFRKKYAQKYGFEL